MKSGPPGSNYRFTHTHMKEQQTFLRIRERCMKEIDICLFQKGTHQRTFLKQSQDGQTQTHRKAVILSPKKVLSEKKFIIHIQTILHRTEREKEKLLYFSFLPKEQKFPLSYSQLQKCKGGEGLTCWAVRLSVRTYVCLSVCLAQIRGSFVLG